jgi:hypothetical protein
MTDREQAQAELDDLVARTAAARERLREAVRAEIRAMPAVPQAEGYDAVAAALRARPGFEQRGYAIGWWSRRGRLQLGAETGGALLLYVTAGDDDAEFPITTLDAAVKAALLWLADRDVFLPARAS